jgi:D-3-phosphoglycerate dehydrogenase / 2-oxoglutarate reductase
MTASAEPSRILVTPRSLTAVPHPALDRFRQAGYDVVLASAGRQPDEAELLRLIPPCVGWLAGVEPVSEAVIAAAPYLRVISRNGVGIDNLPIELLEQRGIAVRRAPAANATGVAELALGLILCALRHIHVADAQIKSGGWPRLIGRELRGRTLGIVGCGAIGAQVATLAAAFGANVIGFDPLRPEIGLPQERFRWVDLDALFKTAEIVSLHCPPNPNGQPLVDRERLASMREGAVLVNTSRAALVDEGALTEAVSLGKLSCYATDVLAEEPPLSLDLAGHPAVIATSHVGGLTEESVARAIDAAVTNLLETLNADDTGHGG